VLELSSLSSRILYNKGLVLLNLKRYKESIDFFDRVIDLKQDNIADAYTSKATALDYLKESEEAEKFYALAAEEYSTKILKLSKDAENLLKSGDYEKALKMVEQILTIESNNTYGLYLKALALFNLKRYKESIPVFEKYIELDPNNVKALSYLGQSYYFYEQYDKAINFLDKVIDIKQKVNDDDAGARYYKGNSLLYLNRLSEAKEELKKALFLYEKIEDREQMMQSLKMLRSIYSNYYDNFDFNKSLSFSHELIKLDKDRIEFKLMLAEDYIKLHNIFKADRLLNEIQDFSKDKDGEKYKKIQKFLNLCSNFIDLNELNDHVGLTAFYKFFTSKEFNDSKIPSDFWNFNAIKYVIEESSLTRGKIDILFAIISYYQYPTTENKKNVEYLITSYLGETTIKQAEKISETTNQYKKLKLIVIFTIIGIVALLSMVSSYYATANYIEYPAIVVPNDIEDWTINPQNETLYYITKSGKFVEYDLRRDRSEYVGFELSTIFGNNQWINQFLYGIVFPKANLPIKEYYIGGQPMKLIYDENKDFIFIIDKKSKNITVIKNGEIGNIILKGRPTDIEFKDEFIYISTKKPNSLSIFKYPTVNLEIKKIKTINLIHNPEFIVNDKDNNMIFLINSNSAILSFMNLSFIENNFEIIQQPNQDRYIKNINLRESNFVPVDASYNDNNSQIMIHNLKNQELIIIDATDPEKLQDNNIKNIKKKIPFENSYFANIEIGNKNDTFISVPNTKTIHIIKTNNITENDIYKIKFDDISIGKVNFNDKNYKLFIHVKSNNTIIPIDFNNSNPGDHINVGQDPFAMIYDDNNSILYVTNRIDNSISMIDTNTNDEINIPVGIWPNDITFDNDANKVFVVNSNFNGQNYNGPSTITIIDKLTNESSHYLTGGYGSNSLGVDKSHRKIYISNFVNNTVSVLDYNGKILHIIPVNIGPVDIAVNPSNNLVYVANYDDDSISIIDTRKYNVIQNLTVGNGPNDIVVQNVSDSKSKIFIVNSLSDTVSRIEIDDLLINNYYHKVTNTISVGKYPISAAYFENSRNKNLYVSNSDNTISVINTESSNIFPKGSIPIQSSTNPDPRQVTPSGIAVNSKNGMLYVSSAEYDMVSLYNGTDFELKHTPYPVQAIQAGKKPYGIKIDQVTGNLYVPNLQSDFINVFSKNESFSTNINVANISYLDIDQYNGKIYVSHKYSNNISVYSFNNTNKKFEETNTTIFIGYTPSCIFVDEYNSRLLVAGNNMLTVYDLHTLNLIKKNIPIGLSANSIAIDESMNKVYLNDPLEDEFLVLEGTTYQPVWPDLPDTWAGESPSSIAVNQKTGDIYISNKNSDSITKLDPTMTSAIAIADDIGKSPTAIAINSQKDRAYVVNEKSHTISIIDTVSNKILRNVPVGKYPNSIDLDIHNDDIYVTSSYTNNIYKFHDDTITKGITSSFNEDGKILSYLNLTKVRFVNTTNDDSTSSILPFKGNEIVSDSKNVYVSSIEGKLISKISFDDNNLTNLEINTYPSSIALDPNKNQLYVLDDYDQRILIINTNKFEISPNFEIPLDSVKNISSPDSIAVDTTLNKIYVTDKDAQSIFVIDIRTNRINEIHLSGSPDSIAVDTKTHKVYGTYDKTASSIFVIQNNTAKNIDFPKYFIPKHIFFTDSNTLIFDSHLKYIILLDNNDIFKFISYIPYEPKFKDPKEISIDAKSKKIYAINNTHYISIDIPEIEKLKNIYLPSLVSPVSIAVDTTLNKIYIVDRIYNYSYYSFYANSISIIDSNTNKIVKKIPFHGSPDSIAVDTTLNKIYVTDNYYNSISIIDSNTNKIEKQFQVGDFPVSIAVDSKTHKVYIVNQGNYITLEPATISIIDLIK
jgi:YVTN family beta-propeller protein